MAKKILIVEDEDMLKELYERKFGQEGFEIFSTESAKEAIELAKKEQPDLILLDMLLPDESGLYCLQELKKDKTTAKITVIAFSNFDDPITRKQAHESGVGAYLIKSSYTPKQIVEKVKKYLNND